MRRLSVLIVERDRTRASEFAEALQGNDLRIRIAASVEEALRLFDEDPPEVIVMESMAADTDGRQLLEGWPRLLPVPVVLVVVLRDTAKLSEVVRRAAARGLRKMNGQAVYNGAKERLIVQPEGESETSRVPEILGKSACMEDVRRQILDVARSDLPVLLTGETGTGKDLAAGAIHRLSDRGKKPFIKHNCATSVPQLFESKLFGSREGSFTGATQDRRGLLELAHGGVLFLDELEVLDPGLQASLLRVMEDGEVRPIGSVDICRVSVRFIAATNRDPRVLMAEGKLRDDFLYRVRGFEIRLPALCEHPEDIPLLAERFLREAGSSAAKDALEWLKAQKWPGNVRELRFAVLSAAAVARGRAITAGDLLECRPALREPPLREGAAKSRELESPVLTLKEVERRAVHCEIRKAMEATGGNRSQAARLLGIARSTLRRLLRP